jgi:acetolactate synthase-1/3 small subunit
MLRQLEKLYDVKAASLIEGGDCISVEHLLVKLKTDGEKNLEIVSLINQYGGKMMNIGEGFIVADVTGKPERIQEFIEACKPVGVYELCRSGTLALSDGKDKILGMRKKLMEVQKNGELVL